MILNLTIGFIIGLGVGISTRFLSKKSTSEPKKSTNRKGILTKSYTTSSHNIKTGTIEATFEVEEIEKTSTKSKLKVLEVVSSDSAWNNSIDKKKLISMVDNTWEQTSDVEWIEKSLDDVRDEKLKQILS